MSMKKAKQLKELFEIFRLKNGREMTMEELRKLLRGDNGKKS